MTLVTPSVSMSVTFFCHSLDAPWVWPQDWPRGWWSLNSLTAGGTPIIFADTIATQPKGWPFFLWSRNHYKDRGMKTMLFMLVDAPILNLKYLQSWNFFQSWYIFSLERFVSLEIFFVLKYINLIFYSGSFTVDLLYWILYCMQLLNLSDFI